MKKIILLLILFAGFSVNAQSVELPEFVIQGVKKISLPKIEKSKPEFIKPLGDSYFKHKFKPEDFNVSFVSRDTLTVARTFVRGNRYSGRAKLAGGLQTLPEGELFASYVNDNFSVLLGARGKSVRSYEPYSASTRIGGKFSAKYFTDHSGKTLPLTYVGMSGESGYSDVKFWASENPSRQRRITLARGDVEFYHFVPDKYKATAKIYGSYSDFWEEDKTEQTLGGTGSFEYYVSLFKLRFAGEFLSQSLLLPKYEKFHYYSGEVKTEIEMSKNVFVNIGAVFAFDNDENFFYPVLGATFNLGKYFLLSAQIDGEAKYLTNDFFMRQNPYYAAEKFKNIFTNELNRVSFTARFNYQNKIDAKITARYGNTTNFYYYDDSAERGVFEVKTLGNVSTFALDFSADLIFFKYGFFSVSSRLQTRRTENWNVAPYSPEISARAFYSWAFSNSLTFSAGINYFSGFYVNVENSEKTEAFADIFANAKYLVFRNLKITAEVNNILNKNNYYFPGYKTTPFDVLVGIEYFWK